MRMISAYFVVHSSNLIAFRSTILTIDVSLSNRDAFPSAVSRLHRLFIGVKPECSKLFVFVAALPICIALAQFLESGRVLLRCRSAIPVERFSGVAGNAQTSLIALCQFILGQRMALLCSFTVRLDRLFQVRLCSPTLLIKTADPELCHRVPLFCRSFVPMERFCIIWRDGLTDLVIPTHAELCINIALRSSLTIPMQRSAVILRYTLSVFVSKC